MTNHIHLIAIPKREDSLAKAIGETHRLYTRKINFGQKVRGHLFQERFYSTPLCYKHLLNAIKYVEQNPVKAGMVKYPWEYEYSSALHRLDLVKEDKVLSSHESIEQIINYKDFLLESSEAKMLEEKTRTGKPCGDEEFYDKVKVITGIDYKNKKTGPKSSKENN